MKKTLICLAFLMLLAVSPLFAQPLVPQLISPMPGQPDLPPLATELVWMQPDHNPDYWFQVYLSLDPGFPEPPVYEGPALEFFTGFEFHFPAPELLPLQTYNWKIRVTDMMSMLSSESDMWFFLTAPLPLEPPQLIYPADQATDIPTGGIDLVFHLNDWQYHVDSFFDIFLDIDPDFPNPEQFSGLLDPDRMDFHYYVPALQNAQTYYWYVRYHHPVENYVLDSQVYSFLTGTYIVPSSTISVTLTNNSSYNGTWAYVTCTGACAPWTRKMTFGTTYNYMVNNGLNPIVTPTLPVASPSYFFSPYPIQFNNIQSNQTANFTLNTLLPPPVGTPVPIDLASNVSINIGCLKWNFDQWTGYGTPDAFAVYFPAYEQTPYTIIPYTGKRTEYLVPIPALAYGQDYSWKVVPYNTHGEAENVEIWTFSAQSQPGPPVLISPPNGEEGVPAEEVNLLFEQPGWTPDSFFDIFVDIDPGFPEDPIFSGPLTPTSGILLGHEIGPLMAEQMFHWKVRVTQGLDQWTSAVHTFRTGSYVVPTHSVSGILYNQNGIGTGNRKINYYANNVYMGSVNSSPNPTYGSYTIHLPDHATRQYMVKPVTPTAFQYWSPTSSSYTNLSSDQTGQDYHLYSYTPNDVIQPLPENLASNVSVNIGQLQWSYFQQPNYGEPLGFEVYFPAGSLDPYAVVPYVRDPIYTVDIPPLEYDADYSWKVVPYNTQGAAEIVEIWTFSTQSQPGPPVLISPADGEQGVPAAGVNLQFEQPGWVPDSFFDVFFDLDPGFSNPPAYSGPLTPVTGNSFEFYLVPLIGEQDYYWKVRYTSGPEVWDSPTFYFATGPSGVALHNLAVTLATTLQFPSWMQMAPRVTCTQACFPSAVNTPLNTTHNFKVPAGNSPTVNPFPPGPFYYFIPSTQPFPPMSGNQSLTITMYSRLPGNAVNPIPGIASQNVAINTGFLRWSYLPNSCYADPTGFKVYFPADNVDYVYVPYVRDPDYELPIGLLEYDHDYTWKVVPFNIEGEAEFVEEWYFSTEPDPFWPSDLYIYPSNHQPSVEDAGLIMVWGTPDEGREDWPVDSFFDVWVDIDPDFSGLEPIYSGPGLISPLNPLRRYCHAPQLQLGTLYYWRIRLTLTGTMEEHNSPIWDFITQDTQLVYPSPILVSPPDLAEAVPPRHTPFVWELPTYPPDSFFDVFVSIDPAFPEPPIYTGPGIPVFPYLERWVHEHPLLLDEQAYYWYVRVNDLIYHWYRCSDVWEFTTGGYLPPEPPILVSPLNGAEDLPFQGVDLEWQTDPDWWVESFFDVFCDIDPSFPAPPVYSGTGTELLVDGIFVFNQANLLEDEAYHWYVRITDMLTEYSSNSPVWTFTTAGLPPPILSIDENGVLHWLPVEGADGYRIYRSFDPGIDFTPIHVTTELFWADPEYLTLPKAFYYVTAITMP